MSKKNLIILLSSIGVFAILLAIASIWDLQINIALGNADSLFGQFFEEIGEFPAYIAAAIAFVILYQATTKENKFYLGFKIIFGILSFVGIYFFINYLMGKFFREDIDYKWFYLIVFSLITTALILLATNKADKEVMKKLVIFAIFLIVVLAISQILVQIFKDLWSRLRFRNMNSNYDGFTPWWKMNFGISGREELVVSYPGHSDSDAFRSCPSGHTGAAAMSFVLIMLPNLFNKLKKYKIWFYIVPIVYTLLVAISRIVAKAHFLSDVLFGGTITIIVVFFSRWLVFKIDKAIKNKKLAVDEK